MVYMGILDYIVNYPGGEAHWLFEDQAVIQNPNGTNHDLYSKRNVWSGVLFGIGAVAFMDEAVFHQLLHWHHFYDKSTTNVGLISDGLFHAFS